MARSNPLERALQVLDAVAAADREMSLSEIVAAVGLPQSTIFRLTSHLTESGMLAFDQDRKLYRTGARVHRLAFLLRGHKEISAIVLPTLEALAQMAGESAFFVQRGRERLRLLRYVVPEIGAQSFIHPGFDFPPHATAAGKAIAAFLPPGPGAPAYPRYQDATVTDPAEVARLHAAVRAAGWASNRSELDQGVYSIAAPVFFRELPIGAIGIVGPESRLLRHPAHDAILAELIAQTRHLSRLIGQGGTATADPGAADPAAPGMGRQP